MTDRQHDTISFDAARVALKGASDLADSVKGGLKRGDRARITVEGVVTERKEITRTNGLVEWVKVIEVDTAFGLEVLDRLSELPFGDASAAIAEGIRELVGAEEELSSIEVIVGTEPLTVDGETGEVISSRPPGKAKEPAREGG